MGRNREAAIEAQAQRSGREEGRLLDEVVGVTSLTAAVFALLSFLSYHLGAQSQNFAGRVGYQLANAFLQALGLAAYWLPAFLAVVTVLSFRQKTEEISAPRSAGALGLLLSTAVLCGLLGPQRPVALAGGWVGGFAALQIEQAFGSHGSLLVAGTALVLSLMLATRMSIRRLAVLARHGVQQGATGVRDLVRRRPELPKIEVPVPRRRENVKREVPREAEGPLIVLGEALDTAPEPPPKRRRRAPVQEEFHFTGGGAYQVPPLGFLEVPARSSLRVDEEVLRKSSQILEAKLADFGIQGKVVEVRPGPVITTFDIEPAAGVKVTRILSLSDDLAMALRVPGVRILAPVPGKAVVGIEVANPRREEVRLREILESDAFGHSSSALTLALGKDTAGLAVSADLARMPHLLIAGATGSGKSVAVNAMIMSILYKASPADVRFVMIDMKMLELSVYEDIPHLLVPVVTDPKKAVVVLKNIVEQMEERYRLMKQRAVRGLEGYNRMIDREQAEREAGVIELTELVDAPPGEEEPAGEVPRLERLPKIVVIIDELADLMMTMRNQAEEPITRLAQKARAAGIHLILATQRPSVDVITGLIKANFPARISFQTTSRVDSRTILDHIGAERLLGGGDMLYMPPGTARLQRLHGPLVTESEIHQVVEFIKKQGTPQYAFSLLENPEGEEGDGEEDDDLSDELYDQAVRLVTQSRQASISWVQRRLRVGYNRAARMIERMEREGVVSASDGGRPREVLAPSLEDE